MPRPQSLIQHQPKDDTVPSKLAPTKIQDKKPLQELLKKEPLKIATPATSQHQEEEIEYYEEDDGEEEAPTFEQLKREELRKLRHLLRQNKEIPKIIIIQDQVGNEIEYEVLQESEESQAGSKVSLSLRQVTQVEESVEYYEEIIEESEEETDDQQQWQQ